MATATDKASKAATPLKIAGGVVLLAASLTLMYHRMPHREYAEVHADKPRTKPAGNAPAPAPEPVKPAPQAPARAAAKPASVAAEPAPSAPPAAAPETDDWTYDCRSEIGILCHDLPAHRLKRCLDEYDDALMRPCRRALAQRFNP
jgi:hypothetical protein